MTDVANLERQDVDIQVPSYRMRIGDRWETAGAGTFDVVEPYSGATFARVQAGGKQEMAAAIAAAAAAFPAWAATPPALRAGLFNKAAEIVRRRRAEVVDILARETGSTIGFGNSQIENVLKSLEAGAAWVYQPKGRVLASNFPEVHSISVRRPIGVVASFTPWNGAYILAWRSVIAPIAAGNTVVVKPSEFAPVSAGLVIAEIMEEAGFPAGVINVVTHAPGGASAIADAVFETNDVRCINLTGGVHTARILAERAGRTLKRTVLELGGYNPLIVLDDASVDYAVSCATFGSFFHQGQICMNTRKVIIHRSLYDQFLEKFVPYADKLPSGDPLDPKTIIGPLITRQAVGKVQRGIDDALSMGGKLRTGGAAEGQIYRPTILTDVPNEAAIANEETFGPVVIVEPVDSDDAAVAAANRIHYGLTASILTRDTYRGLELAPRILTGVVNVNSATVNSEMHVPMGGTRDSGWGRTASEAIDEFTDAVWINARSSERKYPV